MYIGTYSHKLDKKGRISLPAEFRAAVAAEGANVVLFKHPTQEALFGGNAQAVIDRVLREGKELAERLFAGGCVSKVDETGRISLPKVIREELFPEVEELLFVGRGWYFEITTVDKKESIENDVEVAAQHILDM